MSSSEHQTSGSYAFRFALAFCALCASPSFAQWTGSERNNAENLTVMIDVVYKDVPTEWGTGIIVGHRDHTLYIVTAKHLLNRGNRQDIEVAFRWKNPTLGAAAARPVTGRASLAVPLPPDLDLAVLKVDLNSSSSPSPDDLLFDVLADSAEIGENLNVRPIGHADGHYWITCDNSSAVKDVSGDLITFDADCTKDGHSGGPIFDESWHLVGMDLRLENNFAVGSTIDSIRTKLKDWNIPDDLSPSNAPQPSGFLTVSVGEQSACGINSINHVLCWGFNFDGLLGVGRDDNFAADVALPVADHHSFTAISTGASSTCGLTTGKNIRCWGDNEFGQLGNGTANASPIPVALRSDLHFISVSTGRIHSCGLTDDGAAWCWGANGHGELGNGTMKDSLIPVHVASPSHWSQISAGTDSTCAITNLNETYCWGGDGSLVLNPSLHSAITTPIKLPSPLKFTSISVGGNLRSGNPPVDCGLTDDDCRRRVPIFYSSDPFLSFACGISVDGGVYCWGSIFRSDTFVQLRTVTTTPFHLLPNQSFSSVTVGQLIVCGVTRSPRATYCWGYGANDWPEHFAPRFSEIATNGLDSPRRLDFEGEPLSLSLGGPTACILRQDRQLFCWSFHVVDWQLGVFNTLGIYETADSRIGNGSDFVRSPWLPVVTNHCSSTNLPLVSTNLSSPSQLEDGLLDYLTTQSYPIVGYSTTRSDPTVTEWPAGLTPPWKAVNDAYSDLIRRIHSFSSEKDQQEPFEKLVERVRSYRFIAAPMVRTCEMQEHSPTVQSLITLRSLGDQSLRGSNPLEETEEKADSRLRMFVLQYRTVAAQISLKELNQ
jgi:hypothetical protein